MIPPGNPTVRRRIVDIASPRRRVSINCLEPAASRLVSPPSGSFEIAFFSTFDSSVLLVAYSWPPFPAAYQRCGHASLV
jgi:hypothetical protein